MFAGGLPACVRMLWRDALPLCLHAHNPYMQTSQECTCRAQFVAWLMTLITQTGFSAAFRVFSVFLFCACMAGQLCALWFLWDSTLLTLAGLVPCVGCASFVMVC